MASGPRPASRGPRPASRDTRRARRAGCSRFAGTEAPGGVHGEVRAPRTGVETGRLELSGSRNAAGGGRLLWAVWPRRRARGPWTDWPTVWSSPHPAAREPGRSASGSRTAAEPLGGALRAGTLRAGTLKRQWALLFRAISGSRKAQWDGRRRPTPLTPHPSGRERLAFARSVCAGDEPMPGVVDGALGSLLVRVTTGTRLVASHGAARRPEAPRRPLRRALGGRGSFSPSPPTLPPSGSPWLEPRGRRRPDRLRPRGRAHRRLLRSVRRRAPPVVEGAVHGLSTACRRTSWVVVVCWTRGGATLIALPPRPSGPTRDVAPTRTPRPGAAGEAALTPVSVLAFHAAGLRDGRVFIVGGGRPPSISRDAERQP